MISKNFKIYKKIQIFPKNFFPKTQRGHQRDQRGRFTSKLQNFQFFSYNF